MKKTMLTQSGVPGCVIGFSDFYNCEYFDLDLSLIDFFHSDVSF